MIANRIPGGLQEGTTEFYTDYVNGSQVAMCLHNGSKKCFNTVPDCRKDIIRNAMKADRKAELAMEAMVGKDENKKLERFIMCRFGALDERSDIDENNALSEPEFVPCPNRGKCQYEGVGCSLPKINDAYLSKRETPVFTRSHMEDKEIADELFISVLTVKKHNSVILKKTGLRSKNEVTNYRSNLGLRQ